MDGFGNNSFIKLTIKYELNFLIDECVELICLLRLTDRRLLYTVSELILQVKN